MKRKRHRTYSIPFKKEEEKKRKAVPLFQQENHILYGFGGHTNADSAESKISMKASDVDIELADLGISLTSIAATIPPAVSGNVTSKLVKEVWGHFLWSMTQAWK